MIFSSESGFRHVRCSNPNQSGRPRFRVKTEAVKALRNRPDDVSSPGSSAVTPSGDTITMQSKKSTPKNKPAQDKATQPTGTKKPKR